MLCRHVAAPQVFPSRILAECLHDWNVTQEQFGLPRVENVATLAELLVASLDSAGFCLSDFHAGWCQLFVGSEGDLLYLD